MMLLQTFLAQPNASRWFADFTRRADGRALESRRWIAQLAEICRLLACHKGSFDLATTWPQVAVFYIRLHGVVEDLVPILEAGQSLLNTETDRWMAAASSTDQAILREALACRARLSHSAVAVRDALSFDERATVWVMRNYNSHMGVESDGLSLKENGQLKETRRVAGRELSVTELDLIRDRMADLHENEASGARAMAIKVLPYVDELLSAIEDLQLIDFSPSSVPE